MALSTTSIEQLSVNTIRTLSIDAVQAANSGHPGTPMALAPVAYSLWNSVLRFDPDQPLWPGRDRFVLSCGHASMLLYSVLHLAQVKQADAEGNVTDELAVSLDHIRNFRQLGSRCPGHPESTETSGVETTTGPLGQGIANSVGMAVAAKWYAAQFNQPGFDLFDYDTYAICSDGDLMEGIGGEAASLAGHLQLDNLCWIYDDNHITIEGDTKLAFSENVGQRFQGYGWNVVHVSDANDLEALKAAYQEFKATTGKPTLIIVRSIIAYGAPHAQNTHGAHGAPLGEDEIRLTKEAYDWPSDAKFLVPKEVLEHFREIVGRRGQEAHAQWDAKFTDYQKQHPELAARWTQIQSGELPESWDSHIPTFSADAKGIATRASSGKILCGVGEGVPSFLGGSADLAPSTKTLLGFDGAGEFLPSSYDGRNMHFGIREHAMAACANGMALSGLRPYVATFFVFSDYLRPSMRLSSLMRLPVIYIFTHDSIGVGEDGPTHKPVEHLAAARSIPGLLTFRPGDANEASQMWRTVMPLKNRPVAMVLTRQNLPTLDREKYGDASGLAQGAYVLADTPDGNPDIILIATGSELSLAVEAHERLTAAGVKSRVVSMPCCELFDEQDEAYQQSVLPNNVAARIAVEAGVEQGWRKYLGLRGKFIGMSSFGASAPADELFSKFGITPKAIVSAAQELLG